MKTLINKIKRKKKLAALLLGALSVLALPPYFQFYILIITFSGLFLLTENAGRGKTAFAVGYWFGFGFFALGFSWVGNALLIDDETKWLYPAVLLSSGLFFGLFTAIPVYIASKFKGIYFRYISFCSMIVIFEWIRSFIFTGFPWNQFGSVLAFDLRLLQTASIYGTYGLSLLTIMFCSAPALFINEKDLKSGIISSSLILFIMLGVFIYGNFRIRENTFFDSSDVKIRIVQPSIPQKFKWGRENLERNFEEYIRMSRLEGFDDIDFVIWGETASPFPLDMAPKYMAQATEAVPEKGWLVTGSMRYEYIEKNNLYRPANSLFVINSKGGIDEVYDKHHLVPFGEFIPFKQYLPKWIKPITNIVGDFQRGEGHKVISLEKYPSFGPLICYEIIFPSEIVEKSKKPEWIINVTNDGWYGDSMGPYQHLVTTQLRAIEEGITIARAANTGISALISYTGEILGKIPLSKSDILDIYLPQQLNKPTLYGRYGNYLIFILFATNIFLIFMTKKSKI